MANHSLVGIETATSLMLSYEALAIAHKKAWDAEQSQARALSRELNQNVNLQHGFALLVLNASVIEGTLRTIISEDILSELQDATRAGSSKGRTGPTKAEALLSKYHSDIEMQGGWEKIKEQYSFYYDLSLSELMGKDLKDAIEVLFTLRNVISHGTAIIQPSTKMDDTLKDVYPYKWQAKLQGASVYLKKVFSHDEIFKNLREYNMPEHFLEKTKELFQTLENRFTKVPDRAKKTIDMVKGYRFGYRSNTM